MQEDKYENSRHKYPRGGGGGGHFKINGNLYTGNEKETKKNIKTGRNTGREKGKKGERCRVKGKEYD